MHPRARQQHVEMFIGIFGFFTAAALITTIVAELRGQPAIKEVFVLVLFGAPLLLLIRVWRRS